MLPGYKKKGELLVYYDENGEALYGFEFAFDKLQKFVRLTDEDISAIVLPDPFNYAPRIEEYLSDEFLNIEGSKQMDAWQKFYLQGCICIGENCFKGISHVKLVVPFSASVKFEPNCFDKVLKVDLFLQKSSTLKKIERTTYSASTGIYDFDSYYLVADKRLKADFKRSGEYGSEEIEIKNAKHTTKFDLDLLYRQDVIEKCR